MRAGEYTPTTSRPAPAGFESGPSKLKIVRTASALRAGITCRIAAWCAGANKKPKPTSSMSAPIAVGGSDKSSPSSASTSAAPEALESARLPCLAILAPAAQATKAAAVETLKVRAPSPPVPTMSQSDSGGKEAATGTARARMTWAAAAISIGVSPLALRAIKNPAICASLQSPLKIASVARAASAAVMSRPAQSESKNSAQVSIAIARHFITAESPPVCGGGGFAA